MGATILLSTQPDARFTARYTVRPITLAEVPVTQRCSLVLSCDKEACYCCTYCISNRNNWSPRGFAGLCCLLASKLRYNYRTLTEKTGKLVHAGSLILITGSFYTNFSVTTAEVLTFLQTSACLFVLIVFLIGVLYCFMHRIHTVLICGLPTPFNSRPS